MRRARRADEDADVADDATVAPRLQLLRSKLAPPQVRRGVALRVQLMDRLREGRGKKLTLVCAPAGYGKTTVLAQWREADREGTPFAWMSADESDGDPIRFWSHLIAGLRTVHPRAGTASLEALRGGPRTVGSVALSLLVDELSDAPPSVLVVDDWHLVQGTVCNETMQIFVEHRPPAVQIVLSSRSDPNLPVGRWRAHGELSEVRAADLQLSHAEAASFLHEANVDLRPEDIARLTERTEGWAAGINLASILLQHERDPHAFVLDFAGDSRHLLEYISDDVLASVGEEMRDFLLRSSVLVEVSGAACDAVLETHGSAAMLAEIERANLFLVPVDRHGETYRFHGLFRDVLSRELARERPEVVAQLHARASLWFEAQGDAESAVHHAIAGRDLARASDLVTFHQRSLMNEGRLTTLARWLEELSWPEATAEPQLALVRASLAAQTARPADEIERWLAVAAAGARPGPLANGMASIESCIAILRSLYLAQGVAPAVAAAKRALELERPGSGWRRQALIGLGQALYLQGKAGEARAPLVEAQRIPYARDHAPAAAAALAYLALVELDAGDLVSAKRHVEESFDLLEAHGLAGSYVATNTHVALAGVSGADTDRYREVEQLELAVRLSVPSRPSLWHAHALLRLASARRKLGEVDSAREALESARADLERLPDPGMLSALLETTAGELVAPARHESFYGEPLSEAELRVLALLATGRSVSEVARELYLAPNTVKTHRRKIYRKLGVTNRQEAIARAADLSLTQLAADSSRPTNHPG
ncbi:MAG: LuxR C-terminal-related transcriptional regulator [Gaiellaceae bacterium]